MLPPEFNFRYFILIGAVVVYERADGLKTTVGGTYRLYRRRPADHVAVTHFHGGRRYVNYTRAYRRNTSAAYNNGNTGPSTVEK